MRKTGAGRPEKKVEANENDLPADFNSAGATPEYPNQGVDNFGIELQAGTLHDPLHRLGGRNARLLGAGQGVVYIGHVKNTGFYGKL